MSECSYKCEELSRGVPHQVREGRSLHQLHEHNKNTFICKCSVKSFLPTTTTTSNTSASKKKNPKSHIPTTSKLSVLI